MEISDWCNNKKDVDKKNASWAFFFLSNRSFDYQVVHNACCREYFEKMLHFSHIDMT